jgi:hypothetical protein
METIEINNYARSDYIDEESDENESKILCNLIFIIIFSFTISSLLIIFIVYMIIGLIQTSINEINNSCPKSHLWYYSLIALILLIMQNIQIINSKKDSKISLIMSCIQILQSIVMLIWGSYELFGINCVNEFKDTILYNTALIYWILIIVMYCIYIMILVNKNKKKIIESQKNLELV